MKTKASTVAQKLLNLYRQEHVIWRLGGGEPSIRCRGRQ